MHVVLGMMGHKLNKNQNRETVTEARLNQLQKQTQWVANGIYGLFLIFANVWFYKTIPWAPVLGENFSFGVVFSLLFLLSLSSIEVRLLTKFLPLNEDIAPQVQQYCRESHSADQYRLTVLQHRSLRNIDECIMARLARREQTMKNLELLQAVSNPSLEIHTQ